MRDIGDVFQKLEKYLKILGTLLAGGASKNFALWVESTLDGKSQ